MNYLKKIRKGKYALENDGTLKELIKALGICWPDDDYLPSGKLLYYFQSNTFSGRYDLDDNINLTTIKVTDFLEWYDSKQVFTIKDLSDGKCAVINDGTLDELNEVLKAAFPGDGKAIGECKFYYRAGISLWSGTNDTHLPTQSVKTFIKELRLNQFADMVDKDLVEIQNPIKEAIGAIKAMTELKKACIEEKKLNQTKKPMKPYPLNPTLEQAREIYVESERESNPYMSALYEKFGDDLVDVNYGWYCSFLTKSPIKASKEDITRLRFPTKEQAEAFPHFSKVLMEVYKANGGWLPDWSNNSTKFCINVNEEMTHITLGIYTHHDFRKILAFKSRAIAEQFAETHRELILKAKALL